MLKRRLQELFSHPGFISLVIWAVLILSIPLHFQKYRITKISEEYLPGRTTTYYYDLDSDGNSERISVDLNDLKQTKIIVSKDNTIFDQYDLRFQIYGEYKLYAGDYNNDGFSECYLFTISKDSIFLNIIDPLKQRKLIVNSRFIDLWREAPNSLDIPIVVVTGMIEGNNKRFNDLIFYITTGYCKQPRNVYRYSINEDLLLKSPESGETIRDISVSDINGDSLPEFLLDVSATGNFDLRFPYSDRFAWLMVLDHNLKFLFPPVKIGKNPSNLQVLSLTGKNRDYLTLFYDYCGTENTPSSFYLYDISGNKLKEMPAGDNVIIYSRLFPAQTDGKTSFFFLKNRKSEVVELDSGFKRRGNVVIPSVYSGNPLRELDADLDGSREIIFQSFDQRSLIIVRNDFTFPVIWQYSSEAGSPEITQFLIAGRKPDLYLHLHDRGIYLRYGRNPFYYLRYPFFVTLYLIVFSLVALIARIQLYRFKMKQETERGMAALQMKAIKNQVDPHFTLNVLNAIGSLYASENDRQKADYIFGKYARLIRETVITSDQITVSLAEELDFVKNYVEIERFRYNNSFGYSVRIDKEADMKIKIPRMLVHTFVENGIKYGIRSRHNGGLLKVDVQTNGNYQIVIVEDNGPGIDPAREATRGTGRGLVILNELLGLYFKLEKIKITYTLENVQEEGRGITGTRATISIPGRNPKISQ